MLFHKIVTQNKCSINKEDFFTSLKPMELGWIFVRMSISCKGLQFESMGHRCHDSLFLFFMLF